MGVGRWCIVVAFPASLVGCTAILGAGDLTFRDADAGPDAASDAASDAACAQLDSDPENCGACGHDCLGGACAGGVCQPVVLAGQQAFPSGLALFGDGLYWTNAGRRSGAGPTPEPDTGAVMRIARGGGIPAVIAAAQDGAGFVAVDESGVYWDTVLPSVGSVHACPLAGCGDAGPLALAPPQNLPAGLALDEERAYWSAGGVVWARAKDGGAAATGVYVPSVPIQDVAVDRDHVFWAEVLHGRIRSYAKDGGVMTDLYTSGNDAYTLRLALDATRLYWSSYDADTLDAGPDADAAGSALVSLPLDGDGGDASVLAASPVVSSSALALDPGHVFVVLGGVLAAIPKGGGAPVTIAPLDGAVTAIAVDDAAVYWAVAGTAAAHFADGKIMKVAR